MSSDATSSEADVPTTLLPHVGLIFAVFISLLFYSAIRAPVPGVNEPHYLTKAKHYWNPNWCRGDLFLESSSAHLVFYQTLGRLTQHLTLSQTAWVGRIASLLLLALGWTGLISRLVSGRWASLYALWAFLAFAAVGNLSGEWLVGGVEAKVFSYGLLFWSLAFVCEGSWNRAAVLGGLSISLHPVIGLWGIICLTLAMMAGRLKKNADATSDPARSSRGTAWILPLILLVVAALPGLVPAMSLLGNGSPRADVIQVYQRLAHHLDPMQFSAFAGIAYGLLTIMWLFVRRGVGESQRESFFAHFVIGSLLIAIAGLLIGLGPRPAEEMPFFELRTTLLKFYPFRLFDVLLPMAVACMLVARSQRWFANREWTIRLLFGGAMVFALLMPSADRDPSRMKASRRAAWFDVCVWVNRETANDTIVLTPRESWAFKWFAQRAEYVSHKDCPQDADGILEWDRRWKFAIGWHRTVNAAPHSLDELRQLRADTDVTHVIAHLSEPYDIDPIYSNWAYAVYQLPAAEGLQAAEGGQAPED